MGRASSLGQLDIDTTESDLMIRSTEKASSSTLMDESSNANGKTTLTLAEPLYPLLPMLLFVSRIDHSL
jgi:hypothetical protein